MTLLEASKQFWMHCKRLYRFFTYAAVSLLVLGVTYVLGKGYLDTPPFLFRLKERMEADPLLIKAIGPTRGYVLRHSKVDLADGDTARFSVQVTGQCDSTYVLIKGIYCKKGRVFTYLMQDTALVNKCR